MKWIPKNEDEKALRNRTDAYLNDIKELQKLENELEEQKKKADEREEELDDIKSESYKNYKNTKNHLRDMLETSNFKEIVKKYGLDYNENDAKWIAYGLPTILSNSRDLIDKSEAENYTPEEDMDMIKILSAQISSSMLKYTTHYIADKKDSFSDPEMQALQEITHLINITGESILGYQETQKIKNDEIAKYNELKQKISDKKAALQKECKELIEEHDKRNLDRGELDGSDQYAEKFYEEIKQIFLSGDSSALYQKMIDVNKNYFKADPSPFEKAEKRVIDKLVNDEIGAVDSTGKLNKKAEKTFKELLDIIYDLPAGSFDGEENKPINEIRMKLTNNSNIKNAVLSTGETGKEYIKNRRETAERLQHFSVMKDEELQLRSDEIQNQKKYQEKFTSSFEEIIKNAKDKLTLLDSKTKKNPADNGDEYKAMHTALENVTKLDKDCSPEKIQQTIQALYDNAKNYSEKRHKDFFKKRKGSIGEHRLNIADDLIEFSGKSASNLLDYSFLLNQYKFKNPEIHNNTKISLNELNDKVTVIENDIKNVIEKRKELEERKRTEERKRIEKEKQKAAAEKKKLEDNVLKEFKTKFTRETIDLISDKMKELKTQKLQFQDGSKIRYYDDKTFVYEKNGVKLNGVLNILGDPVTDNIKIGDLTKEDRKQLYADYEKELEDKFRIEKLAEKEAYRRMAFHLSGVDLNKSEKQIKEDEKWTKEFYKDNPAKASKKSSISVIGNKDKYRAEKNKIRYVAKNIIVKDGDKEVSVPSVTVNGRYSKKGALIYDGEIEQYAEKAEQFAKKREQQEIEFLEEKIKKEEKHQKMKDDKAKRLKNEREQKMIKKIEDYAAEVFQGIPANDLKNILNGKGFINFPEEGFSVGYSNTDKNGMIVIKTEAMPAAGGKNIVVGLPFTEDGRIKDRKPRTLSKSEEKELGNAQFKLNQQMRALSNQNLSRMSDNYSGFVLRDNNKICGVGVVKDGKVLISMNNAIGTATYNEKGKINLKSIETKLANDLAKKKEVDLTKTNKTETPKKGMIK